MLQLVPKKADLPNKNAWEISHQDAMKAAYMQEVRNFNRERAREDAIRDTAKFLLTASFTSDNSEKLLQLNDEEIILHVETMFKYSARLHDYEFPKQK